MKTNPPKEGASTENSAATLTVTREVVGERGAELAVITCQTIVSPSGGHRGGK
jgi:hypothetical protein